MLANNSLPLRVAPLGKGRVSFLDRLLAWFTGGLSFPLAILLWMGRLPLSLLFSFFRSRCTLEHWDDDWPSVKMKVQQLPSDFDLIEVGGIPCPIQ